MAILKVAQAGHPILRKKTALVKNLKSIYRLVDDMFETMEEYGGIGIAAPQVHHGLRLAIVGIRPNSRYPDAQELPSTVMINPKVKVVDPTAIAIFEGCLSVQGLRGKVPRAKKVQVSYQTLDGKKVKSEFEGFGAIVVQHELDHLDGVLYIDKAIPGTLCFEKEFEKYQGDQPVLEDD